MKDINLYYLDLALKEAQKAFLKDEVPVGAILTKDNQIIARGHNLRISKNNAIYHAEIVAIEKACKKLKTWRLDNCSLFVTLEPCLMCAGAIIQSRIKNVIFGAKDDKGGAIISKYTIFDDRKLNHHPNYVFIDHPECSKILKDFFIKKRNINNL
jgi:tRNA-adenosine deaminase (EC 3.5.4.-)